MPAKNLDGLAKHTLHLYDGDFRRLGELYPSVPPSETIRNLIRNHINKHVEPIKHESINSHDIDL